MLRSPLSGDVVQRFDSPWFAPHYTFNYAGNATIEQRIAADVASVGRQIGWLNEVVLALARNAELPEEVRKTLQRMDDAAAKIDQIKAANKQNALDVAIDALDRLQQDEPDAYADLLHRRR
jgi:hypothetical protein